MKNNLEEQLRLLDLVPVSNLLDAGFKVAPGVFERIRGSEETILADVYDSRAYQVDPSTISFANILTMPSAESFARYIHTFHLQWYVLIKVFTGNPSLSLSNLHLHHRGSGIPCRMPHRNLVLNRTPLLLIPSPRRHSPPTITPPRRNLIIHHLLATVMGIPSIRVTQPLLLQAPR